MSGFTSKWLVQSSKAQTSFLPGSTLLDSSVLGVLAVEVSTRHLLYVPLSECFRDEAVDLICRSSLARSGQF